MLNIIKQAVFFLTYFIFSWVLVHFFAVFGIFVALSFLILWFLTENKTICLFCKLHDSNNCVFCKKNNTELKQKLVQPKGFLSLLLNVFFLIFLTMVSISLVYMEYSLIKTFLPEKTSFNLTIPTKARYKIGEKITLDFDVKATKKSVNVVQADIAFDPKILQIKDVNIDESFATIFIQKEVNNELGYARITGGVPNPGFKGEKGHFAQFVFVSVAEGVTEVEVLPTSQILINDGKGTNILSDFGKVSYLIMPEITDKPEVIEVKDENLNQKNGTKNSTDGAYLQSGRLVEDKSKISSLNRKTVSNDQKYLIYHDFTVVLGASTDHANPEIIAAMERQKSETDTKNTDAKSFINFTSNSLGNVFNYLAEADKKILDLYQSLIF